MKIDDQLLEQLEEVRTSGKCNMFSMSEVQYYANEMGLYQLVSFIQEEGTEGYTEALQKL